MEPNGDHIAAWADIRPFGSGEWLTGSEFPALIDEDSYEPAWSPDGQWILVATSHGLRKLRPSGGFPEFVTAVPDDHHPAWSPDGMRVAYSSIRGGDRDLWILDPANGTFRQLTGDVAQDFRPAWSPDGNGIAFESNRFDGTWRIWVIAATGGTPVALAEGRSPAWSPDGGTIAFERGQHTVDAQIWIATDLPDWRLPVAPASWSRVKDLYRR